jgi:hypothetical protein
MKTYEQERDAAAESELGVNLNEEIPKNKYYFKRGANWSRDRFEKEIERIKYVFLKTVIDLEKKIADQNTIIDHNYESAAGWKEKALEFQTQIDDRDAIIENVKEVLEYVFNGKTVYNTSSLLSNPLQNAEVFKIQMILVPVRDEIAKLEKYNGN